MIINGTIGKSQKTFIVQYDAQVSQMLKQHYQLNYS